MPDLLLPINIPAVLTLAIAHCAIGTVAAVVAQRRGLPFQRWLLLGLIGGTVALVAACVVSPKTSR